MESDQNESADSKPAAEDQGQAPPVIESVARGIGTAVGVIASGAAKIIGKSEPAEVDAKPKEKERAKKTPKPRAPTNEAGSKFSASRIAKKKKKRAAHRKKLKRSSTKG